MMNRNYYYGIADKAVALDISVDGAKRLMRQNYKKRKKAKRARKWFPGKFKGWRQTLEYYNWRRKVLERDNWTCVNCQKTGGVLCGHHILNIQDLRFDVDNGVCLCERCHNDLHKGEYVKLA